METGIYTAWTSSVELPSSDPINTVVVGYNVNLGSDELAFAHALDQAELMLSSPESNASGLAEAVLAPLNYIDAEARQLAHYAEQAAASGDTLSPSEVVMLTARSQEFLFHSQLTANIANRSAEGLQQLLRQQG